MPDTTITTFFPKPTDAGAAPVAHLTPVIMLSLFNAAHAKDEGFVPAEAVDDSVLKWVAWKAKKAGWTAHEVISDHVVLKFVPAAQKMEPVIAETAPKASLRGSTSPSKSMFGRVDDYPNRT